MSYTNEMTGPGGRNRVAEGNRPFTGNSGGRCGATPWRSYRKSHEDGKVGLGRHDWGDVHFWTSVALGVLLVVHVALHWSWVCLMVHRLLGGTEAGQLGAGRRNAYGIGFLLAVVLIFGGFTWYAGTVVTHVNSRGEAGSRPQREGTNTSEPGQEDDREASHGLIRGSMTLAEVETATGVSAATLKSELGLPKDISAQERIGRLARQYGFSVEKVRDVVVKHTSQPDKR